MQVKCKWVGCDKPSRLPYLSRLLKVQPMCSLDKLERDPLEREAIAPLTVEELRAASQVRCLSLLLAHHLHTFSFQHTGHALRCLSRAA